MRHNPPPLPHTGSGKLKMRTHSDLFHADRRIESGGHLKGTINIISSDSLFKYYGQQFANL